MRSVVRTYVEPGLSSLRSESFANGEYIRMLRSWICVSSAGEWLHLK